MLGAQLKILVAPKRKIRKLQTLVKYSFFSMLSFISILCLFLSGSYYMLKITLILLHFLNHPLRLLLFECLVQWNPDFLNTRLFETSDSSNQKSFPLDLLQSNTIILLPIFQNSQYFELIFSSFQKFTFDFSNSENSGTNKNRF